MIHQGQNMFHIIKKCLFQQLIIFLQFFNLLVIVNTTEYQILKKNQISFFLADITSVLSYFTTVMSVTQITKCCYTSVQLNVISEESHIQNSMEFSYFACHIRQRKS